jgi:hypothetical protein
MDQGWDPEVQAYRDRDGKSVTRLEVKAEIARRRRAQEKAYEVPTQPTEPCWIALTPQGPVMLQASEAWVGEWDGSLIRAYQTDSGSLSQRPSILQVIQMEPLGERQALRWAQWAGQNWDFYLIP